MNLLTVSQIVRVDITDSDYDEEFIAKYHNKVGTLTEIVEQGADTLYCVSFPTLENADFAKGDLVIRP